MCIVGFEDNIEEDEVYESNRLKETLANFKQLYILLEKLDE